MTTFVDIIENASEELYQHLQKSSNRSFRGYEGEKALPRVPVPGELAYFLDDLIQRSAHHLGYTPEEAVADVIDLGIVTWYERLSGDSRARMGLPPTSHRLEDVAAKDKMLARLNQAQTELEGERSRLIAEISKLREGQGSESETVAKLKAEIAEMKKAAQPSAPAAAVQKTKQIDDDGDPDPAIAQARIHAMETQNLGYTEMTAHAVSSQPGQGKKQRNSPGGHGNGKASGGNGKNRSNSGGGKGNPRGAQARRRSNNGGRSQRTNRRDFSAQ